MKCRTLAVSAAILAFSPAAWAQTAAEGSLRGYVTDEQGAAVPGVTVTATSPNASGVRTAVSDSQGYYRLLDLPPAEYTITAELQGFATVKRSGVVTRAGLNLALDLVMKVGAVSETVEVESETPLLEARTAVQAVNVSGDFQRAVPMSTRRLWTDFLRLSPGVTVTDNVTGAAVYYVNGSTQNSHVFQMDGADMTSVIQGSSLYTNLSLEALGDVQVKTSAVDASAPLGFGAIVSVTSPSGTDQLKGALGIAWQPKSWNGDNARGGTPLTLSTRQLEVGFGGPIRRERWWFHLAFTKVRTETALARNAQQLSSLRAIAPQFEPFDNRQDGDYLLAKVSGQPSPNHRVVAFYNRDYTSLDGNSALAAERFERLKLGGPVYALRLSSVWGGRLTSQLALSYNEKAQRGTIDRPEVTGRLVHERAFATAGRLQGTGALAQLDANTLAGLSILPSKWTLAADATYRHAGSLGSHEVQGGLFLQPRLRDEWVRRLNNGGFLLEEVVLRNPANPGAGFVPFHRQIWDQPEYISRRVDSRDLGLFAQDVWRPTGRLTVTAGIRVDFVRRVDRLFGEIMQDSQEVGPRLGANYALTADHRTVLRGSWGRLHDNVSVNQTAAGTNVIGFRDLYDLDLDGAFETVFTTPGRTALTSDRVFDLDNYH